MSQPLIRKADIQMFSWRDLDGQTGTIRISEAPEAQIACFHANSGEIYVLASARPQKDIPWPNRT